MKISCELCRKSFKVSEKKLTSRGITVHCPRCKHPHLIKRVVEAYPIGPEYQIPTNAEPTGRPVENARTKGTIARDGVIHLQDSPRPPPPSGRIPGEKPQYDWKEFLRLQGKQKRVKAAQRFGFWLRDLWAAFMKIVFFIALAGLVYGFIYFKRLPESEKLVYHEALKALFERIEHKFKSKNSQ